MPYRIDLENPSDAAFDLLVELGALDVDWFGGRLAAIIPDDVPAAHVAAALGARLRVSPAHGRDDGSVWVLRPRPVHLGRLKILPADEPPQAAALRMVDGAAFGTGLHATTALCLEALETELEASSPPSALDVGTGSGILALAALAAGVRRVVAIDVDPDAVRVTAANARLNGFTPRLAIVHGGPESLSGKWPLVFANILTAPLIEMAPTLAGRVSPRGRLILSGIRSSLAGDVMQAYRRVGMHHVRSEAREGWTALTFNASW